VSLLLATLVACLSAPLARAGTVTVDPSTRTIETSRLLVQFDMEKPEVVIRLLYKDFSTVQPLSSYYITDGEYWGESMRNTSSPGFISEGPFTSASWTVTQQSASHVELTVASQTPGQPPVVTRYHFYADQPYFLVYRTIQFSVLADTSAYQAYLPRVDFISSYRAVRWRDTLGVVQQRGYCITPCLEGGWNGRWVEQMGTLGPHSQFGVVDYFTNVPARTKLVDGWGPDNSVGWIAPLVPAGSHTQDATSAQLIGFTLSPDNYARLDSMWNVYASGVLLADVPTGAADAGLRIAVSPNPARGATRIDWASPVAGAYALDVLDVAGRRIARLGAGWAAAGTRRLTWDGRDERGGAAPPGLYFVRLAMAGRTRVARLVRAS
jgi:hypothetical protein